MKKITLAALMFAASTAVFAQEATFEPAPAWTLGNPFVSEKAPGKTREQVRAELEQARKDGTIKAWSAGYFEPVKSVKTRAEVLAELNDARRSGEFAALNAEAGNFNVQQRVQREQRTAGVR